MNINILYIGYYKDHNIIEDNIYINTLKDKNYNIYKIDDEKLTNNDINNADIIICGSFLQNTNIIEQIIKNKEKIIYNITEPVQFNNISMYNCYINNIFNIAIGCVPENNKNIKFPLYIDFDVNTVNTSKINNNININNNSCEKIININNIINNITKDELFNKNFCCLINRHDFGNTRKHIYNKLIQLFDIVCPSVLFNNFDNITFEKIGREIFQNQFIFSICPENYITSLDGYVTEKLFIACSCGNIPIYYGKLDEYDRKIYNTNRIIEYNPESEESINNTFEFIKDLVLNPDKLYDYYKQPVFLDTACDTINYFKANANYRINFFINNILTNKISYTKSLSTYKLLNYNELINYKPDFKLNNISNIIISIDSNIKTIKSINFKVLIDNLLNQTLKLKYIFINIILLNNEIINIETEFPKNVYINYFEKNIKNDYHIINLNNMSDKIDINDKILFITDSFIPNYNLVLLYELCYQLYNCDGITINNNDDIIFCDNIINMPDLDKTFSFKYKILKDILINTNTFEIELYKYSINNNLYLCSLSIFNLKKSIPLKMNIENLNIQNNINKRYLLFNINNITYEPQKNDFNNKQIDIKYYNKNIIILTITYFIDNNLIPYTDTIFLNNYIIKFNNNTLSNKITLCIYIYNTIELINHADNNYNIIQIDKNNNININKFYSIMTILNYCPDIEYKFFNNNDINNLLDKNKPIYNLYNSLNDIKSKIELFKTWYLYNNGGLYFNCKNILYNHITELLYLNEFYINDIEENHIYLNFLFNKTPYNNNIKIYLINICYNIYNKCYNNNYLFFTNSELLGKIINKTFYDLYLVEDTNNDTDTIVNSYIINESIDLEKPIKIKYNKIIKYYDKILIKLSYNNYYNNNESLTLQSINFWKNNILYNNININYNNINYINHIVWINLDRSSNRRENMELILSQINCLNTRISAIDGLNIDLSMFKLLERPLTNYEIAVTLSHIKAINYLNNLNGEYFCVCEDDISFINISLFNHDLEYIIKNAPVFDILILSKTYNDKLNNLYTKWNEKIYGAVCYIISKKGINKIISFAKFYDNNFDITKELSIADWFLYTYTDSYVYKYNYISSLDQESIIHPEHLSIHKQSTLIQLETILSSDDFLLENKN